MKKGLVVLAFLILGTAANSGQLNITSLPFTINQSSHTKDAIDTVTIAGTRLSSLTGGIRFSPGYQDPIRGWLVNLVSDTIEFGTGGGSGNNGIIILSQADYPAHNVTINGGWIICKPPSDNDTNIADNTCLTFGGEDLLIKNVNMVAGGYDGKCVLGRGYDVEISGGQYLSNVNYYHSRCQFDAIIMNFTSVVYDPAYAASMSHTCNIKIHDIKIVNAPHAGIRVSSTTGSLTDYAVVKIYNNNIMVDAHNFRYTSYSGTCNSSSNPYAIALQRAGPGSEIYNNTVTSGTTYGGGRGMLLETVRGDAASYVEIYNNNINIHEGPNVEYDETHMESHAVRMRNDCSFVHFHNNTVIGTGDANTSSSSYGRSIASLRYTFDGTYGGVNSYNLIENNTFRSKSLTSGVTAYAACFDAVELADTTLIFRYNRLESDNILVKLGEINGGAKGITLSNDTLAFLTPNYSPQVYHVGQFCNNFDCSRNFGRDNVYLNGAADTNIIIACTSAGNLNLGLQRMVAIKVLGNNGYPVAGATVQITNNYHKTVVSGLTGAQGTIGAPVNYWWESGSASDSIVYNNFTFKVKKGSDSTTGLMVINALSAFPNITLAKTAGDTAAPCDTCGIACGDINGDRLLNVLDITYLVQFLYRHGPAPVLFSVADTDRSGSIDILDLTNLIRAVYKGQNTLNCQ